MEMPDLKLVGTTPWNELKSKLQNIPLLHPRDGEVIRPYRNASIDLVEVRIDEVRPTSLYLARNLIAVQRKIADVIKPHGYDPLNLDCGLLLSGIIDGQELVTGFIPPIVEKNSNGLYIVDGSHRVNIGRIDGRKSFKAIVVDGVREDCPFYAETNSWDEIVMYDEPPREPALRKRYLQTDIYSLYRDFSQLNASVPRNGDN